MTASSDKGRRTRRLAIREGAVITLTHAAELLPIADREARAWLRQHDLVRLLAGRPVVVWRDILDALSAGTELSTPTPVLVSLPRERLKPL